MAYMTWLHNTDLSQEDIDEAKVHLNIMTVVLFMTILLELGMYIALFG